MSKNLLALLLLLFCAGSAFAQPAAPAVTGVTAVCAGTGTTVTASGQPGATFRWWNAATGGTQLATTAAYTVPAPSTAGVYHFYAEQVVSGLVSSRTDVAVTVYAIPQVAVAATTTTVCPGISATLTASGAASYAWNPTGDTAAVLVVSPSASTTYTVTGTTSGCSASASVGINRYQVGVVPKMAAYCTGGPVTLNASGGGTYSWTPGGSTAGAIAVAPSATTSYTVTGTLAGCTSSDTAVVTVPPAAVQVTAGPAATVAEGTIVNLTATTNTGTWSNWETSQSNYGYNQGLSAYAVPTENTTYTVTVTDNFGCSASASTAISVARLPAVTGILQLCSGGSTTLTATGTGPFTWYGIASGGTALYTGASYATPTLSGSTSYWVSDNGGPRKEVKVYVPTAAQLPVPVAFPAAICAGDSSRLRAASYPGLVKWYDAPTGGALIGTSTPTTSLAVAPALTTTYYAEGVPYQSSVTFNATGAVQTWTVPDGVTSLNVVANGAKAYGNGGRVEATMNVSPGQVLYLYLGTSSGWNGGGVLYNPIFLGLPLATAGGATDIRVNGQDLVNRVVVAGGGGFTQPISSPGQYGAVYRDGNGGGLAGQDGGVFNNNYAGYFVANTGRGGSQSRGGDGGTFNYGGAFGNGAGAISYGWNGLGGGGWYGGGASTGSNLGGGGGSSYTNPQYCQNVVHTQGGSNGEGQLTISYGVTCTGTASVRAPVVVTVPTFYKSAATMGTASSCEGSPVTLIASGGAPSKEVGAFSGGQVQTGTSGTAAVTTAANNFTLDFWVKPTDSITLLAPAANTTSGVAGQRYAVYPLQSGTDAGAGVSVGKNGIQVCEHGNNYLPVLLSFKGAIPDSVFTHVAVVYTAKTPALYINGALVATGLTSSRPAVYPSIGSGGAGGYGPFKGQLDNVRIWAAALTQAEIRGVFNRSDTALPGKTLAARYSFNGGSLADDRGVPAKAAWSALTSAPQQDYYTYVWSSSNAVPPATSYEVQTATVQSVPPDTRPWYLVRAARGSCVGPASDTLFPVFENIPTATVTGPAYSCVGADTTVVLQGFNARAPFTFSYTVNGGAPQTVSTVPQRVRYIRLRQNAADCFHLSELRAIDYGTGANVALGKTVTASSANSTDPASNLTDGDAGSKWHSASCAAAGEFVEVDLGAAYRLDNIQVINRQDCCWDRARNLQLVLKDSAGAQLSSRTIDAYQGVDGGYTTRWPAEVVSIPLPTGASGTYQYAVQSVRSNLGCTGTSASSLAATVLAPVAPVITLTASTGTELCTAAAVTFTPILADTAAATYMWYRNGVQAGTGVSFTSPSIANRDSIALVAINTRGCVAPTGMAYLKMRINTPLTDSIIGSGCGLSPIQARVSATPFSLAWKRGAAGVATRTVAWGTGVTAASALGSPAQFFVDTAGTIYVSEGSAARVTRWAPGATSGVVVAGGNGSGSGAAQLSNPSGVYVTAAGDVYVSDAGNHRVQRWSAGAATGTTVAGAGAAGSGPGQLSSPAGLTIDAGGNLFIADFGNNRVQRWAPGAATGRTVAGSPAGTAGATTTLLNHPAGVAVDEYGSVFIADRDNHRVVKWTAGSSAGTVLLGTGAAGAGASGLNQPAGVAIDGLGNVYIADGANHRIQRWDTSGATSTIAGTGSLGTGAAQLTNPAGVVVTRAGQLYVADRGNNRVQAYTPLTDTIYTPVASGVHTAVATSFDGCPSVSPAFVVSTPVIRVPPAFSICQGLDTVLQVSGFNATAPYSFTYSINGGVPQTATATATKARYVRLTQTVNGYLRVAELRVFDKAGNNVAINKPISSAYPSISGSTYASSKINDNNTSTSYWNNLVNGTSVGAHVEIDLGQDYVLDRVEVYIPNVNALYPQYVKALKLSFKDSSGAELATQQIDAAPNNTVPALTSWAITQSASNTVNLPVATGAGGVQNYTFTTITGTGCSATINTAAAVTVKAKATVAGLPASVSVCNGAALNLAATAAGAASYQWLKGDTVLSGATGASYAKTGFTAADNGVYRLTTLAANGCTDTSVRVQVTAYPVPSATLTGGTTVCQGIPVPALAVSGTGGVSPYSISYKVNGGAAQTTLASGAKVRYVRVTQNLADWANIAELQAIEAGTGVNVALNKPATASSSGTGAPASNLTDGSTAAGNYWHSATPTAGDYAEIDLGSPGYTLSAIRLTNRADCCGDRSRDLQLTVKDSAGTQLSSTPIDLYTLQDTAFSASFPLATPFSTTIAAPSGTAGTFTYKIASISAGGCASTPTDSAVVTVNAKATMSLQPPAALQVCTPNPLVLSAAATNATAYQWRKAGVALAGATAATYQKSVSTAADAGSYLVIALGTAGCNDTSAASTVTAGTLAAAPAAGAATATLRQADGIALAYTSAACEPIADVADAAGGNVLGLVSTSVVRDASIQAYNNRPYLQRHYDITPASNGAATVSLYATQAEFNAYNAWVTAHGNGVPKMPTGSGDAAGIANLSILQFHGLPSAGTNGPGGQYLASGQQLIANASITTTWNGSYWKLQFPVSGFSGFFITTGSSTPLAVALLDLSARNQGAQNLVAWRTGSEAPGDYFDVERSTDGRAFRKIGTVGGVAPAGTDYTYTDAHPAPGVNYYRLVLGSASGAASYSAVVSARVAEGGFAVDAFPNPVTAVLGVRITGAVAANAQVELVDAAGRVVRRLPVAAATVDVPVAELAAGLYLLRYSDSQRTISLKVTKD